MQKGSDRRPAELEAPSVAPARPVRHDRPMLEMLALSFLVLLASVLAARMIRRRRKNKKKAGPGKSALDLWIEEVLAVDLARKIGSERDVVLGALRDDPQVEAVGSIEQAVRSVQLAFERLPGAKEAEVRVQLGYEDGTQHVERKRVPWSDLPEGVREEFARTAGAHVYRPWHFPWSDPDRR